jgi:hypothetical protein
LLPVSVLKDAAGAASAPLQLAVFALRFVVLFALVTAIG